MYGVDLAKAYSHLNSIPIDTTITWWWFLVLVQFAKARYAKSARYVLLLPRTWKLFLQAHNWLLNNAHWCHCLEYACFSQWCFLSSRRAFETIEPSAVQPNVCSSPKSDCLSMIWHHIRLRGFLLVTYLVSTTVRTLQSWPNGTAALQVNWSPELEVVLLSNGLI